MIYVGIDDTDTLDDPGTNQLARHIVAQLAGTFTGHLIVRHQLLEDPRVPCTRKNGCASLLLSPRNSDISLVAASDVTQEEAPQLGPWVSDSSAPPADLEALVAKLRAIILPWCPRGSDPGLCVAETVPPSVIAWGRRCQRDLVTQAEARQVAAEHEIHLEGLGGTEDGVIGALAAIGLLATHNDGRVIYLASDGADFFDVTGLHSVADIHARGVQEIRDLATNESVTAGKIDVGKRLRPNYRDGRIVLFVTQHPDAGGQSWDAVRIT